MASRSELTLSAALFLMSCPSRAHADKRKSPAPRPAPPLSSTESPLAPRPSKRTSRAGASTKQERPWDHAYSMLSSRVYASKEFKLAEGPMNWISLNGRNRGEYWLLKADHFHVDLQPISETFTGSITARVSDAGVGFLRTSPSLLSHRPAPHRKPLP